MEAKRLFKNSPKKAYSQKVVMSDVLINEINEVRAYRFKRVSTPTIQLCLLCHGPSFGQEMLPAVAIFSFHSVWRLCAIYSVFSFL